MPATWSRLRSQPRLRAAVARIRLAGMMSLIVAFALFSAFTIFAAVATYWQDIVAQPPSAAAFLGALAGAGGGLLAIILGALLNAELNRRRDDRLRREKTRALAVAISGELKHFATHCRVNADALRTHGRPELPIYKLRALAIGDWTVFDAAAGEIGLLGTDLPNGLTVLEKVMSARRRASILRALIDAYLADPATTALDDKQVSALADIFESSGKRSDEGAAALREHEPG